jgi:hypothetical protein
VASEHNLLRHEHGVELWEVALRHDETIITRACNLKTLRTPEVPAFNSLIEAGSAFDRELALSKASDFVSQRLNQQ